MSHGQHALLGSILDSYRHELGSDIGAYRNHVGRVLELFLRFMPECERFDLVVIAACFHDLGVWTHRTFDYLEPSVELAQGYLLSYGQSDARSVAQVSAMIREHHKLTRVAGDPVTEAFRRADWVDLSRGWRRFGVPAAFLRDLEREYPNAGFHSRLIELTRTRLRTHPTAPLPMLKW
jgi:hypothetical protein